MNATASVHEGYIPFRGFRTWFRVVGGGEEPGKPPILTLHGGPGAAHDYLEPLEAVVTTGRRVIFYDQLGCGNSGLSQPAPGLWTVGLYVDEINIVRDFLAHKSITPRGRLPQLAIFIL